MYVYILFTVLNEHMPKKHILKREDFTRALNAVLRMRKYAFLYAPQTTATSLNHIKENIISVYVINKIETYTRYTYPTVKTETSTENDKVAVAALSEALSATSLNATALNTPYRTVSHYGFNYPLTYLPSISLYPDNLLHTISDEFVADLHLQRNLVVEFLKSATVNISKCTTAAKDAFVSIKEIHFTSPSSCNETETEEEPNYTTVKKLQLSKPNNRKRVWLRTASTCSSTAQTATTSSVAYAEDGEHNLEEAETSGLYSLSTHFDDADWLAGSCSSLHCAPNPPLPPPPPPLPNKNFLRSYIIRNSPSRRQSSAGVAELQFARRQKPKPENVQNEHKSEIQALDTSVCNKATTTHKTSKQASNATAEQSKEQFKQEASTSVKAEINATKQTLDLTISVHIKQNQWTAEAFKNLSQIIEAEMQILSQQLAQHEQALNPKRNCSATTSSLTVSNANDNHFSQNFQLLEKELEKLLNSILCVNALTQNLRTAYNEA